MKCVSEGVGGMGVKWDIVIGRGSDRSSLRTGRQKWMYWTYVAHPSVTEKWTSIARGHGTTFGRGNGDETTLEVGVFGYETLRSL